MEVPFLFNILLLAVLVNSKTLNEFSRKAVIDSEHDGGVQSRILGGLEASLGQFPWQALLYVEYPARTSFGGGVLITSTRVLTVAHMWYDGSAYGVKMTVYLGTNKLNDGVGVVASDVIVHEEYNDVMSRNDLAMVYLPYAVEFTDIVKPIALPTGRENEDFVGTAAIASGFGMAEYGLPGTLMYVNLEVLSNEQCIRDFGFVGIFVQPSNICTSGAGNVGICSGDSGGPLITYDGDKAVLIGLSSFRSGGCYGNWPSAYTRVTSYLAWIDSHL